MGVGSGGQRRTVGPLDFLDGADKVEGGLMVLFFGRLFRCPPFLGDFSVNALDSQLPCLTFSIKTYSVNFKVSRQVHSSTFLRG